MNDPKKKAERNEICGVRNGFAALIPFTFCLKANGIFVIFFKRVKKVSFFKMFVLIAIFISR